VTTLTQPPTPSDRLALAICNYRPSICNEPCLLCRAQSATVACELAAILRERHGGSSAVADWLDGVGAHCDKPTPLTEPQNETQNIEKGCSQ
jgi:hypothetical protein